MQLTAKQKQVLDHLKDFVAQHGHAPTLQQIGQRCRLRSLATVHKHLTTLENKGWITREKKRSGFTLTDKALGIRSRLVPVNGVVIPDGAIDEIVDGPTMIDVPTELGGDKGAFALRIRGAPVPGSGLQDGDYIIARESDDGTGRELVIAQVDGRLRLAKQTTDTGNNCSIEESHRKHRNVHAVITGMLRTCQPR